MIGRYYDIERFNRELDIRDVMDTLGLENSTRKNISCPSPNHTDKKPSAHIYTDKNICKCFACDKTFNVIGVVSSVLEVDWRSACDYLISNFDCRDFYKNNIDLQKEPQEFFPLRKHDIEILGLCTEDAPIPFKCDVDSEYEDEKCYDTVHVTESVRFSLRELWKSDRVFFTELVLDKIPERRELYIKKEASGKETLIELGNKLKDLLGEEDISHYLDIYEKTPKKIVPNTKGFDALYLYFSGRIVVKELDEYENSIKRLDELESEFSKEREEEYDISL